MSGTAELIAELEKDIDREWTDSRGLPINPLSKRAATALSAQEADIARLHRCIDMAMGCLDPLSKNTDEKLAWYRLLDAQSGKEPRAALQAKGETKP